MISMQELILAEGGFFHILAPGLSELLWGTLAFIIVAVAVYKYAWPAYVETLDERAQKIDEGLREAEQARAEIADSQAKLVDEIRNTQREATGIRENAQDNAKAIIAEAQAKARTEADSLIVGAHRRIDADSEAAMRTLRGDVGVLATELAGRIVGEAIRDEALARRVIDRFLDDLETMTPELKKEAEA
ncbi:F0F1 ATP synthase subunit B [Trueperella pyogenes]|uniref:F0F1 ATP synthase subunit B n=2 Tax=Trueperella pyogenes TaxID=1661 RepID=UPI00345D2F35